MTSEILFRAAADTTRQRVLQILCQQELMVSDLVDVLRLPQSTVSRHLKVLRDAGLIQDRREGATVIYSAAANLANGDPVADLHGHVLGWLADQPIPQVLAGRLAQVLRQRQSETESFFERVGHRWAQIRLDCFGAAFQFEALAALLPHEWRVTDIGTGTGDLLPLLSRTFRQVIAVDPVPAMLDVARSRPDLAETSNVDFRTGDLSRLPIQDAATDLAVAILVLHHVPSPPEAVAELARVVKPGGSVLIVEQEMHQRTEFFELMQDRWWGFEPAFLAQQFESAGFEEVRSFPLSSAQATSDKAPDAPALYVLVAKRSN